MPPTKTEAEIFAETCAGVYRAVTELENVAKRYTGNELQHEAFRHSAALQKILDRELAEWNEEAPQQAPPLPIVCLCAGQANHTRWSTDKCAIYLLVGADSIYCPTCSKEKEVSEAREYDRHQERLMEVGR